MRFGLSDKSENGRQRPSENTALFARKGRDGFAPPLEFGLQASRSIKEGIQTLGESARSALGLQSISNRHLLKGKKKVRTRFDPDGVSAYLQELCLGQLCLVRRSIENGLPFFMSSPLISSLPSQIGLVIKTLGEKAEELASATGYARLIKRWRRSVPAFGWTSAHCGLFLIHRDQSSSHARHSNR
jgi:hypothetical protein